MKENAVRVKIPATTANLGPGFDTMGMALNLYNEIILKEDTGFSIFVEGEGAKFVSVEKDNLVYQAVEKVFEKINYHASGLHISIKNEIPVSRGLGSSAAAIVGGLVAANELTGKQLSAQEILNMANEMEGHPDNVAPALLGGLVISSMVGEEPVCFSVHLNENWSTVVFIPDTPLSTQKAREVMPREVSLKDAVFNVSKVAMMTAGFVSGDLVLAGRMMEDRLHQPYRMPLIRGAKEILSVAKQAGAYGSAISGAGSTLIAFCEKDREEKIKSAMEKMALLKQQSGVCKVLRPISKGAEVLSF